MTSAEKNSKLIQFGEQILYKRSLQEGLPLISSCVKEIIGAERCSMFVYSPNTSEFWTTLSDGVERIIIPSNKGLVGKTLEVNAGIVENNPYNNASFLSDIDTDSGYITQNIITEPIYNTSGKLVGVLELLNKEGGFSNNDAKYMRFFARSLCDFIDIINLYKE